MQMNSVDIKAHDGMHLYFIMCFSYVTKNNFGKGTCTLLAYFHVLFLFSFSLITQITRLLLFSDSLQTFTHVILYSLL